MHFKQIKFRPYPVSKIESGEITADALISIRCHEQDKPNIPLENFGGNVLYLQFDDVALPKFHYGNKDWYGPTVNDLDSALTFVDLMQERGVDTIAVHCQQGKSRSAALALILRFYVCGNSHESVENLLEYDVEQQMCFNPLLVKMSDVMWKSKLDEVLQGCCPRYVTWKNYWMERGF